MTEGEAAVEACCAGTTPRRVVLVALIVCAAVSVASRYAKEMLSDYRFERDARQHVWWMYKWSDPELFPDDPAFRFFSLPIFAPVGYQAVYRVLVPFADAQHVSEVVPIVLVALTVAACFACFSKWCGGRWLAPAVGSLLLVGLFVRYFRGGIPRVFALPVVAAFAWLSTSRRVWPLGLGLLLAVLFYPPPVIVLGLTSLVVIYWRWRRGDVGVPDLCGYAALTVAAAGLFLACYVVGKPDWIGPRPTREQYRTMAEFRYHPGEGRGRSAVFGKSFRGYWIKSERTGFGSRGRRVLRLLTACLVVLALRRFRDPVPVFLPGLAGSALLMFAASHLLMPMLFYPNRHVQAPLIIVCVGLTAVVLCRLTEAACRRWPELVPLGRRIWWVLPVTIVAYATYRGVQGVEKARELGPPHPSIVALMDFCRSTPKDTLFAGLPYAMDNIPFLAQRSVLAAHEHTMPHYLGYYAIMRSRMEDEFRLLYATSWEDATATAARHGVDYVVVPVNLLDPDRPYYHPPVGRLERELRQRASEEGAAMLDPPLGRCVLSTGRYRVVDVRP